MAMQSVLEQKIRASLAPVHFEIENESHKHSSGLGADSHFKVLIVSQAFKDLKRIERQRQVYGLFQEELKSIHALSLRLLTPGEWNESQSKTFQTPNCQSKAKF
jgi:stress-induced morphogen